MREAQNLIILCKKGKKWQGKYEIWGGITQICDNHPDIIYKDIRLMKFPFTYKDYQFIKLEYRTKY